jgi:diguanylate cyclase
MPGVRDRSFTVCLPCSGMSGQYNGGGDLGVLGHLQRARGAFIGWVFPAVDPAIGPALEHAQFESVRRQVPMLLGVAALNVVIVMAVCAHDGLPRGTYLWMSTIIAYCVGRMGFWIWRVRKPYAPEEIGPVLRMNVIASIAMISFLGIATTYTFVAGTFRSELLIPMSLGFGTTSIAHCLYTLRPAAIGAIFVGLFPSSVAMILTGSFQAQMLGVSMISVGVLMLRFVTAQYDQLIASLKLARENRQLAHTDSLTGLANRRATMAALESEQAGGKDFAVALIDLDDFKQVNDSLGHHAGDALLCEVAERLRAAACPGDLVGRLGGDEFIVVFRAVADEAECGRRSQAMLAALCRPVALGGRRIAFGASLGYALGAAHGGAIEPLLHAADNALYAAKRSQSATSPRSARAAA